MNCILCGYPAELRLGVCFDCATAQEIIGEKILKESKPINTNKILKGLALEGYYIVDGNFINRAEKVGIKRDEVNDGKSDGKMYSPSSI